MGNGRYGRKRKAMSKKKGYKRSMLVKARAKDVDQIQEEMLKDLEDKVDSSVQPFDEDLPGGGQFFCVETGKHFVDLHALTQHKKTRYYKKRVKELKEQVYNLDEAASAAGFTKEVLASVSESRMEE